MGTPVEETFFKRYLERVQGSDLEVLLHSSRELVRQSLADISEEKSDYRYLPEKWSIKQVMSHVIDVERVMAFRALWFGRGGTDQLKGFDDVEWEAAAITSGYPFNEIISIYLTTRENTIGIMKSLSAESLARKGTASDVEFSVDSLFRVIIGHEQHHMQILKERYLN